MASSTIGVAATSTDGTNWTHHTIVEPPSAQFSNLFSMCEGASSLYVTYFEATKTGSHFALRSSTDEGASWSSASTHVSLDSEIPAGLDPTCAAKGSEVWVAYALTDTPQQQTSVKLDAANALRVAHSADEGSTFGSRFDALDTAATARGCLPVLVAEVGTGMDLAYIGGASDGDTLGSIRFVRAPNATSYGLSREVDGPMRFDMSRNTTTWIGDYFDAAFYSGALHLAYPRNETGQTHIFFQKVELP